MLVGVRRPSPTQRVDELEVVEVEGEADVPADQVIDWSLPRHGWPR
jgi:hypothetical protein